MSIKVKRDTAAQWVATNPVLDIGQPGYDITNNQLRIGNGSSPWLSLSPIAGGSGSAWGGITGTLSAQTDLQAELDGKATTAQGALADTAVQPAALAAYQPVDADLTAIAALTATTDNFLQSKAGAWASRTVAQVKADLGLTGTNTGDQSTIVGITGTKAQFDTAVTDGNFAYVGDAPTSHTHLLAAGATDVTITAANLNALDDGINTALHFHDADRARANHTGTQAVGTITGLGTLATQSGTFSGTSSGTNTGDQTITLTGDITGSGTGSFVTAITTNAVVLSDLAQVAASTFMGRITAATGNVESLTVAQAKTVLAYTPADIGAATAAQANATHTGDATGATALTLATVNANVGSFGLAASVAQFTVNAKGLITAAANAAISIAATAISDSTAAGRAMLTAATAAAQTALLDVFTSGAKGLVPASGGGTTNFLRADGTFAAPAGGGSPVTVQDEGVNITTALATLNFVGAGVTVTGGATSTVTIPGGGGGSSSPILSWMV